MEMLRAGGFRRIRMDFGWGATEREKGKYDFSAYDRLLKDMDAQKLRAYWILDYGNTLYASAENRDASPNNAAYYAAYSKWAAAAVAHFKGRGVVWEIWNEPNIGFWKPKPNVDDYSAMALEACRAMRKAAPKECIIGPATSGIDLQFLEKCFQSGLLDLWDGVSVHPYRQSDPETAAPEYRALRALIERYKPKGKTIPIISGEWGYSSAWSGYDVERQGKYLPRQWLLNQYEQIPISVWYDWHDDGTDEKEPEHHFGSVQNAYHENRTPVYDPKPAYIAAQTLYQTLDGFNFNKRLWTGNEKDWILLFTRSNEIRLACWTTDTKPHEISFSASNGTFSRADYLGKKLTDVNAQNQKLNLTLSDGVQYVWPQKPNALLKRAAAWKRVPLETFVSAPRGGVLRDNLGVSNAIKMDGSANSYQQSSMVSVTNPLFATPVSAVGARGAVQILNPTGAPFSGKLRVSIGANTTLQALTVMQGEAAKTVEIVLPANAKAQTTLGVQLLGSQNQPQTGLQNVRFVPVDDFARAGALGDYAVVPDGDAKIASTQTLKIENAPEKLLGQDVPALRLDYKWDAGWKFVRVLPPNEVKIEGAPKALQMWIYGDGNNHRARLRVRDAGGQTFQPNGVVIDWKGWRPVTFPLDGSTAGHWGGADDGKIHGALSWDSLFLLDSAGAGQGTIYLAAPTLVYDVK